MAYDIQADPRLDPRIKSFLALIPQIPFPNVTSREEILEMANSPAMQRFYEARRQALDANDQPSIVSSDGLSVVAHELTSTPDGNTIRINVIRPDDDRVLPCVYYIHGGGMRDLSAFEGNYRAWGKMIAHGDVVVAMVEFRNSITPSTVPEVAPYPAGLNDCVSGLRWVHAHAGELGVDTSRVVIAGDSGGGNLAIATTMRLIAEGDGDLQSGLMALCPYIVGQYPDDRFPSTVDNNGILLQINDNQGPYSYGIDAYESRDPMAWPIFATTTDVAAFPPTIVHVNECDPLRDEGIWFYRLLLQAGVAARCTQANGTMHATELIPMVCPDISRAHAADLARFATTGI